MLLCGGHCKVGATVTRALSPTSTITGGPSSAGPLLFAVTRGFISPTCRAKVDK